MKILNLIWLYLKDWKNLFAHSIIGFTILLVALYLPVKPVYRMLILILVVAFNILRMKLSKKKSKVIQNTKIHNKK